jgi:hypothetical protein
MKDEGGLNPGGGGNGGMIRRELNSGYIFETD